MMTNYKISIVNSMFSQDAGPPILPTELAFLKASLCGLNVSVCDLDIRLYNELNRDLVSYHLLQCIFGGFPFSYPLTANLPFNEYPFEALSTVELLLALIYADDFSEELLLVTERFGLNYPTAYSCLTGFLRIFKIMVGSLVDYNVLIVSVTSPAAVFAGILLGYSLRRLNLGVKLIGIGNDLNVPEVAQFAKSLNIFNDITGVNTQEVIDSLARLGLRTEKAAYDLPDISGFPIADYPLFTGLRQISYSASQGCPYRCNFCSERMRWDWKGNIDDKYQTESIDKIVGHINFLKEQFGISIITFSDCMINANYKQCRELCEQITPTDILYQGAVRADHLDKKIIRLLRNAKIIKVIVGVETVSKNSVAIYNKGGDNYTDKVWQAIPALYDANIIPQINTLICHPYESPQDVRNSIIALTNLAEFLEKKGIPFYNVPVGTLCLNYPSKMYFQVMRDSNFKIIYHRVPERLKPFIAWEISDRVEKLPAKAVKNTLNEETTINKMEFCREIYQLWSNNQERILQLRVASMLGYKELINKSWKRLNVRFDISKPIDLNVIAGSPMYSLISLLVSEENLTYNSLIMKMDNKTRDTLIPVLMTLSLTGLINMSQSS
jgi:radical SAM superfamily enzyme YgiQ (UPF0313 family)